MRAAKPPTPHRLKVDTIPNLVNSFSTRSGETAAIRIRSSTGPRTGAQPSRMVPRSMAAVTDLNPPRRTIRTETHRDCPLCGQPGDVLYRDLTDRLFSAPGAWNFRRCRNRACRHVWLDPQPVEEDIPLIYNEYYTHSGASDSNGEKNAPARSASIIHRVLSLGYRGVLKLSGMTRLRRNMYSLYLTDHRPGRLLEIGCGSGDRLAHFAALGWRVQGQDVDPKAVEHARATTGLPVHLGPIETLPATADPFDAVVMNHVVEHASDPMALLREAGKLLRRDGVLMAVTPNIESFGHARFGSAWLHLDPPRHLHLFSVRTLADVAREAGFQEVHVRTSPANAEMSAVYSLEIARAGRCQTEKPPVLSAVVRSRLFQAAALLRHRLDPDSGEESVLVAERFQD